MRIIPARAGPTSSDIVIRETNKDHPRSCGANPSMSIRDLYCWIIPARAGPTTRCITVLILRTDYPRSCGANGVVAPSPYMASGSSPLVRGQPASRAKCRGARRIIPARAGPTQPFILFHFLFRIIPARAGPTDHAGRPVEQSADHPRSCGANWLHPFLSPSA